MLPMVAFLAAIFGVTVLAQLTADSFRTGWAYYAANIAVPLVLALAANTSFGGLPARPCAPCAAGHACSTPASIS
jgi:hypothetical protein